MGERDRVRMIEEKSEYPVIESLNREDGFGKKTRRISIYQTVEVNLQRVCTSSDLSTDNEG